MTTKLSLMTPRDSLSLTQTGLYLLDTVRMGTMSKEPCVDFKNSGSSIGKLEKEEHKNAPPFCTQLVLQILREPRPSPCSVGTPVAMLYIILPSLMIVPWIYHFFVSHDRTMACPPRAKPRHLSQFYPK